MSFQPDYRNFVDVMKNRRPARLPLYEHIVSPIVMEKRMTPVNLRGEPTGKPERIWFGRFSVELKAFAPASFVLE